MTDFNEKTLNRVADAIEAASCPNREGPFGLYDYTRYLNEGSTKPHCVRDFRDPKSDTWGDIIHCTDDPNEAQDVYNQLTRQHIAAAAIKAMIQQNKK